MYLNKSNIVNSAIWMGLIFGVFLPHGSAQDSLTLNTTDNQALAFLIPIISKNISISDTNVLTISGVGDSIGIQKTLDDLIKSAHSNGYYAASIDSLLRNGNQYNARFYLGPALTWINLHIEDGVLGVNQRQIRKKTKKPFNLEAFMALQTRILDKYANSGYPFASTRFDSVMISENGQIKANLVVDSGKLIRFNALKIDGDLKIPVGYLRQVTGIKKGDLYSNERVLGISRTIKSLGYVEMKAKPSVTFYNSDADLTLYLQKKRNGRFDFILGLLPDPNANDGRLTLTGTLNADFQNALNLGETFSAVVERIKPETQQLTVTGAIPSIVGSVFGASGGLFLFKRDSTWVDAQSNIGATYLFGNGHTFKLYWENKGSTLQKIDTQLIKSTQTLPAVLDFRQNSIGAAVKVMNLDYRFNPRRGWSLDISASAGTTQVIRNNQIEALRISNDPGFRFSTLYDSIATRALRIRYQGHIATYIPIGVRSTVKLSARADGIFSEHPIRINEQYRLGGNKLLRGFNEESLFATRYFVTTAEYRLLVGENSYFSLFSDFGYVENLTNSVTLYQRPLGLGAGINLETKAGIFGLSAAVGKPDLNKPFDLRATKFHIGYVSLIE